MNRLANEKSPYLLQHAANPVDWYPWGEEAFAKARSENRPIFLSIGYSTCHWCHVMAHESFEDPEVASLINDTFVCIKVDREERPDLDSIYMRACTMMTGSGGWPLNIVMTPEGQPFFAGTYFPKQTFGGRIGMLELPGRIKHVWAARQQEIVESAEDIVSAMRQAAALPDKAGRLTSESIGEACRQLARSFDSQYGGFGNAPKFPSPHNLLFLLRCWKKSGDAQMLHMVEATLTAMRQGGIFDQVGFGFHRYSTDRQWLLPHFEKMLYDQAVLAMAYTEAWQATARPIYQKTAQEIFTYVEQTMTHAPGGFFSAEDADSEGVEGKFYLWSAEELQRLLTSDEAALFMRLFNIKAEGNFRAETSGRQTGANIPHLGSDLSEVAAGLGVDARTLEKRLEKIRRLLFEVREQRIHPHKDDKILTDWNGLMIAALAKGFRAFGEPGYLDAAARSADFILKGMRTGTGRLLHRFRAGEAAVAGMLEDYAFLIWGLIELYEAGFASRYLKEALALTDLMFDLFWDEEFGGFFQTPADGEQLLIREKQAHDGAVPSGNAVALANLLRLARLCGRSDLEEKARKLSASFAAAVARNPAAHTHFLSGFDYLLNPGRQIVVVGEPLTVGTGIMLRGLNQLYEPDNVLLFKPAADAGDELTGLAPFIKDFTAIRDNATAYVCADFRCELPTTDLSEAIRRARSKTSGAGQRLRAQG